MPANGFALRLVSTFVSVSYMWSCAQQAASVSTKGATPQDAVPILQVRTPEAIRESQRAWLAQNLPGSVPDFSRSRYVLSTKVIQSVPVVLVDRSEALVYFDVTPR
jgi:hypothetical protein